ncbi:MAG: glycoside-pentoside-hexuronide (GPH):cation symporter [Actinobacteria bacterium]|nr:glycoside-pentoside-hexuronide (GPH):cation symporter [Actinomycetota bacterium]
MTSSPAGAGPSAPLSDPLERRNKWTFGVGTLGRDMVYTLVSMYFLVFLTEALDLTDWELGWVSVLVLAARLFDAVMDVVMGSIVDNTRTRWGHYKPWIAAGVVASGLFTVVMFTDWGIRGAGWVLGFAVVYLLWGLSWTANDIPYWSMLPALTVDQKARERIGAVAKIFATIGLFTVVVAIVPLVGSEGILTQTFGRTQGWTVLAIALVAIMLVGQVVTLIGVKEPRIAVEQERTTLREIAGVVVKNDQLLWTAIAMVLFMTGYITTTSFGVYFFKYAYGDEGMYTIFGAVLGIAQILGFLSFPLLRRRFRRSTLYTAATAMIVAGYIVFFFSPMNMLPIGIAGLLLFVGQSYVVLLMLVFITDTIDYGHWKLGRRNVAVTFALQPFINKVGAALAAAIVGVTAIVSGINDAEAYGDVDAGGLLVMKLVMLVLPLVLIVIGYLIYRAKYRIDEDFHAQLIAELRARGQLQ